MNEKHIAKISDELNLKASQGIATASLLEEDATVPFISRYRKEMTGSLDEVQVTAIRDRLVQLEELDKRRESILNSLEERQLLTDELKDNILNAETMTELEDIYLPYRPKRRTRATIAKEKGLEPLATMIFAQGEFDINEEAAKFISEEKEVLSVEDALAGARDIIAEWINENIEAREKIRALFLEKAVIVSKVIEGMEEQGSKFKDYFDWKELAKNSPSHRLLAMFRGENEEVLKLEIFPEDDEAISILKSIFIQGNTSASQEVLTALVDSYKRLLSLSMQTETRAHLKLKSDEEAIDVFAKNLRELLLSPPLGQKNILAVDPGFRTGCKIVCLDKQGKLLINDTIYPHEADFKRVQAAEKIMTLVNKYDIEVVAVGNGTAGRETKSFVEEVFSANKKDIPVIMVNESGASIYSASDVAREEFPDYDLTVRGSISIGRRLMDPLAELVKIDPKSIGVGQYQHDVNQSMLRQKLDDVVVSCVNAVGVEVNTASKQLLTYVSGIGPKLAQNIIDFRNDNGPFKSRQELTKVPRLKAKAFEQAAGFLRIRGGENPLDESAVHPESYPIVEEMAKDAGCGLKDLISNNEIIEKIDIKKYVSDKIGIPTLEDIRQELAKPGRDPRESFEVFEFTKGLEKIEDLKPGQVLPGVVTNVTNFGAFVDIGVHQDGLVHVSEISDRYITNPNDVLKVHQKVNVKVIEVDIARRRINLSMKTGEKPAAPPSKKHNEQSQDHKNYLARKEKEKRRKDEMQSKLEALKAKFNRR
jgi:Transcriptional accessory protein